MCGAIAESFRWYRGIVDPKGGVRRWEVVDIARDSRAILLVVLRATVLLSHAPIIRTSARLQELVVLALTQP